MVPKFQFRATVDKIASAFQPNHVQRSPFVASLLKQPELLIGVEPAILIALFCYFPERTPVKRPRLEAVEDLFEAKLALGHRTVVAGLSLNGFFGQSTSDRTIDILRQMFDFFTEWPKTDGEGIAEHFRLLSGTLTPKQKWENMWDHEGKVVREQLHRFSPDRYEGLIKLIEPVTKTRHYAGI